MASAGRIVPAIGSMKTWRKAGRVAVGLVIAILVVLAMRPYSSRALLRASADGNVRLARVLLLCGADVNAEDGKGGTSLFLAALNGHAEMTRFLRSHGGDISDGCCYGSTAPEEPEQHALKFEGHPRTFGEYCEAGDVAQVRRMLRVNPKLATQPDPSGWMPLALACDYVQVEVAGVLLSYGASPTDPVTVDAEGEDYPLARAESPDGGNKAIAELLRRHRGTIYDYCAVGDVVKVRQILKRNPRLLNAPASTELCPWTPLEVAILHNMPDVVRTLLDLGANANRASTYTPLGWAAEEGFTEIVAILLTHGANPVLKSDGGTPPLREARTAEVTALLIAKGANVNASDAEGQTPIFWVHDRRQAEILIAFGADPKVRDDSGCTPLFSAFPAAIKYLVSVGVDANARDKQSETALHWVSFLGLVDTARALIDCGADVNVWGDENTGTPLHQAAAGHRKEMIEFLLDHGADINAGYPDGGTPLHWAIGDAVTERDYDVVQLLLSRGAKVNAKAQGKTPLDIAEEWGMPDMVKLLRSYGAKE